MANDKRLDYDKANCKDIDTEIFYMQESQLQEMGMALRTIRKVCFSCEIQPDCAKYAFKYERYGIWGGFTEKERHLLQQGKWQHRELQRMYAQIKDVEGDVGAVWDYAVITPRFIDWEGEGE